MKIICALIGLVLVALVSANEKCPNCGLGEGKDICNHNEFLVKAAKLPKPSYYASPDAIKEALKYKQAPPVYEVPYALPYDTSYGPESAYGASSNGAYGANTYGGASYGGTSGSSYGASAYSAPAGSPYGASSYGATSGQTYATGSYAAPSGASTYGAGSYGASSASAYDAASAYAGHGYDSASASTDYQQRNYANSKSSYESNAIIQATPYGGNGNERRTNQEVQDLLYMKPGTPVAPKFEPIGDLCQTSKSKTYGNSPYEKQNSEPAILGVIPAYPGKTPCKCPSSTPPKAYSKSKPVAYESAVPAYSVPTPDYPTPVYSSSAPSSGYQAPSAYSSSSAYAAPTASSYSTPVASASIYPATSASAYPASPVAPYSAPVASASVYPAASASAYPAPEAVSYSTSAASATAYPASTPVHTAPAGSSYSAPATPESAYSDATSSSYSASSAATSYSSATSSSYSSPSASSYAAPSASSYSVPQTSASSYPAAASPSYSAPAAAPVYPAAVASSYPTRPSSYSPSQSITPLYSVPAYSSPKSYPPASYASPAKYQSYASSAARTGSSSYGSAGTYSSGSNSYGASKTYKGQSVEYENENEGLSLAEQEQKYKSQPTIPADPVSISLAYKKLMQTPAAKKYVPEDRIAFGHRQVPADGKVQKEISNVPEEKLVTVDKPIVELKVASKPCLGIGHPDGYGVQNGYNANLDPLEREKYEQEAAGARTYVSYSDLGYAPVSASKNEFIAKTQESSAPAYQPPSYQPRRTYRPPSLPCGPLGPTVPGYRPGGLIIEDRDSNIRYDEDDEEEYGKIESFESEEYSSENTGCSCKGGIIERIKNKHRRKHQRY